MPTAHSLSAAAPPLGGTPPEVAVDKRVGHVRHCHCHPCARRTWATPPAPAAPPPATRRPCVDGSNHVRHRRLQPRGADQIFERIPACLPRRKACAERGKDLGEIGHGREQVDAAMHGLAKPRFERPDHLLQAQCEVRGTGQLDAQQPATDGFSAQRQQQNRAGLAKRRAGRFDRTNKGPARCEPCGWWLMLTRRQGSEIHGIRPEFRVRSVLGKTGQFVQPGQERGRRARQKQGSDVHRRSFASEVATAGQSRWRRRPSAGVGAIGLCRFGEQSTDWQPSKIPRHDRKGNGTSRADTLVGRTRWVLKNYAVARSGRAATAVLVTRSSFAWEYAALSAAISCCNWIGLLM